jgi:hypothetical protein
VKVKYVSLSLGRWDVFFSVVMLYLHKYLFKLCSCILFNYMFQNLCGSDTKSNWKWILKYVVCDIRKRICNCCLSVKHTQSNIFLLMNKGNCQYYHSHEHCVLFVLHW